MANTSSARKAIQVSQKKRVFNLRRARTMKEAVKGIESAIAGKQKDMAAKLMPAAQKALDKAVKRGIIKPNTASRKKSRLAAAIKALA
ncbi:MAG TPA: 30S ribosomal protein S20 [Candidatus Paceibacterota bacterium]|nr:30S ribosomal protein S20 [Candidatus Paceibacterota bacterium]